MSRKYRFLFSVTCCAATAFWPLSTTRATELEALDGARYDFFGYSVSLSGNTAFVGAYMRENNEIKSGAAYVFRNLNQAGSSKTEDVKLTASDGAANDYFGYSVSLSGNTALVGAQGDDENGYYTGAAYVFRNLNQAGSDKTEDVKLTSFNRTADANFGHSVSLSGNTALVAAHGENNNTGAAYVFRNLNQAGSSKTEDVKLTSSDGAATDFFGYSVSLSGNTALVGAYGDDDNGNNSGSAYLFRNLDQAGSSKTEDVKLTASHGVANDFFGRSVSLSGNTALVGAHGDDENGSESGAAYVFRNLDQAGSSKTDDVKLTASDGIANRHFGKSVSLSGNTALVGASGNDDSIGSAYVFRNLDQAGSSKTEDVKLIASDGAAYKNFGTSVSLDGDNFVIGAYFGDGAVANSGKAYFGSVSSFTTLDEGNTSRQIAGLSFESRGDWVIGETKDQNSVTLSEGDTGNVLSAGKAVYIGKTAGSDNNTLTIEGMLTANEIYVGAVGNSGNALQIDGTVTANDVIVAAGSSIGGVGTLNGDLTFQEGSFLEFSTSLTLTITGEVAFAPSFGVRNILGLNSSVEEGVYTLINGSSTDFSALNLNNWGIENAFYLGDGKYAFFKQGSLILEVVPEPGTYALLLLGGAAFVSRRLRRKVA